MRRPNPWRLLWPVLALLAAPLVAQGPALPASLDEALKRIFVADEFAPARFGPARWMAGGAAYTTLEPSTEPAGATDIVRYDTESGTREVLVSAAQLIPRTGSDPLAIDDYAWSRDGRRLLVYTSAQKVWRDATRGDYWVVDRESGRLRQLGGVAPPATLMFAKFSPDGSRVGYVHVQDLYVEDVETGAVTRLTRDGSPTTINGTSDWVYEEELGLRDAFRWSPDGTRIAYWQFDSTGVGIFTLINDTDALYPTLTRIPYPKVGTTNSAVRVGLVSAAGGETRWMDVPGDPREHYIARMDWSESGEALFIQQLNRPQNRNDLLRADAATGAVTRLHRDTSSSWVEIVDELRWFDQGEALLWISEKDVWRHAYRIDRNGGERLLTDFEADLLSVAGVDEDRGWLYLIASPENATERYLYRTRLDGSGTPERLTPDDKPGTHGYDVSPNGRVAFHTYSTFDHPVVTDLVELPSHRRIRVLEDNAALVEKVTSLKHPPVEFLRVDVGDGVVLDGWMLKPRDFEASRTYPLVVYVYGEPAGQTVLNRWGGNGALFHRALAEQGYVIVSVDNRGTPAPRGMAWRKIVYGTVGDLSSREQAAAVRALTERFPFLDRERVGVWGWSGGGSNTLNAMFRFPEVYDVGVSVAPVPDQRLYDTIYQERYMGVPEENAEGYRLGSPIHFAEGLQGRLLIVHGSGDDNVHYQGTERLVNRLVELGKPFDLMVYPNRSHAISEGPGTSYHVYALIARYFLEHLPPES